MIALQHTAAPSKTTFGASRRKTLRAGVALLGAAAMATAGAAFGAGIAAAATTTTTVTQTDISPSCTTTTTGFCTDLSGTGGSATVKGNPGSGYLDLKTPTGSDKAQVFNTTHNGQLLSSITDLSYQSLVKTAGSTTDQAPTVQIAINPNQAGVTFATLVWEPAYTDTKSVVGTTEQFHPTANPTGTGGWWTSKNNANIGTPGLLGFNQYTASFADVVAAIPDATILGIGVGQGSGNPNLESQVDNFQVNGNTWDFEAAHPASDKADLQVGLDSPFHVGAGDTFETTATVMNKGPQGAGPTQTTVFVPAGYAIQEEGTTAGSTVTDAPFGLGKLVTFTAAGLAPNSTPVTYTVTLKAPGGFAAGFTAAYSFSQTADSNPFNNVAIGFNSSF